MLFRSRGRYIVRAFELCRTGKYGYREIADILFSEGFRSRGNSKVPKSTIQTMLSNPFYCGMMRSKGKIYNGNHKQIISKTLFDKIQETLQEKLHPKKKTLMFPIRGLVKCADCNCMYTASRKKGHDYYYCTNGKGNCNSHKSYLREKDLYKKLIPVLEKIALDKDEIELLYLAAKEKTEKETGYFDVTLENLREEENNILKRQKKLLDIFLDDSISKEVHDKKNLEIENEKIMLQKQISEIEYKNKQAVSTLEPTKKLFLDCVIWSKEFLALSPEKKQNVVHEVLWNLSVKDKNIVNYQLKSPYSLIANIPENADLHTKLGD